MAFETGSATSGTDLLQKLATFLTTAGWTVNKNQSQGSGWWISVQKGSDIFLNFVSDPATTGTTNPGPWIYVYGATGYASGSAYNAQPGTSGQVASNKMTAPYTAYWFFEGDDYIHIVVELEAGRFRHIQGGTIAKCCTFTGGHYAMGTGIYFGSNNPSHPDGGVNSYPWENEAGSNTLNNQFYGDSGNGAKWFTNNGSGTTGTRLMDGVAFSLASATMYSYGLEAEMFASTPNDTNGITPLVPINVIAEKTSGLWAILGQVKDVRRVSMRNYQPSDIVTIGSDEWYVFPWTTRSDTTNDSTTEKSGYYGFAYRKNTA